MVSFGSVLGLLLAGGAVAVGYAVYQNRNALGGALSRGVEVNLTNPFGNWLDSLFRRNEDNGNGDEGANQDQNPPPIIGPDPNNTFIPCSNNPADYRTWCNGYFPEPDQDFLPPPKEPEPEAPEPPAPAPAPAPAPEPEMTPEPPAPAPAPPQEPNLPPGYDPNKIYNFDNPTFETGNAPPTAQYYYLDFIGNIPDQQILSLPDQLGIYEAPNVRRIIPLGTNRPLSDTAFRLFGESKGAYGV